MNRFLLSLTMLAGTVMPTMKATATESDPMVYAYLNLENINFRDYGFYTINPKDGFYNRMDYIQAKDLGFNKFNAWCVFVRDGKLCAYMCKEKMYEVSEISYREYDLETGENLLTLPMPLTKAGKFNSLCYDQDNDCCWGYSNYANGSGLFIKIDMKDPTTVIEVANIVEKDYCQTTTYNAEIHELVGIPQVSGDLVTINTATGKKKKTICSPEYTTTYHNGLCWSASEKSYILNGYIDYTSHILSIDPETGNVKDLKNTDKLQFFTFYAPYKENKGDAAYDLPVNLEPTAEEAQGFTKSGTNASNGWSSTDGGFAYMAMGNVDTDASWLFLPAINFPANTQFTFSMSVTNTSAMMMLPYNCEVKAGLAPNAEAMTETIVDFYNQTDENGECKGSFTLPTGAPYYIGVHTLAGGMMTTAIVNNFKVEVNGTTNINDLHVGTLSVHPHNGYVSINAPEATAFSIFTVDGRIITSGIADGNKIVNLTPGIYVIRTSNFSTKFIVR